MSASGESRRVIDAALADWVRRHGGSEVLARAAEAASRAEGEGHACAVLTDDMAFAPEDVAHLREAGWLGDADAESLFVLEGRRFYFRRNWRHECELAARLRERIDPLVTATDTASIEADVVELFGGDRSPATADQRQAVAAAIGSRLLVLTGGPGTGKTTTVLRLLLLLLRHAETCGFGPLPRIALAAPTGKAAQRLAEAIRHGAERLDRVLPPASALRAGLSRMAAAEALTLHRLLGYRPDTRTFARGPSDPLTADVVVVDEASMADLALMRRLLDALPARAMLVLVGDPDQLASVDAGSVLSDVVAGFGRGPTSPVRALRHVWRADDALQPAIAALRDGDAMGFLDGVGEDRDALSLHHCMDAPSIDRALAAWLERHATHFARRFDPAITPAAALALTRETQLLCALREGPFGAAGLNARLTQRIRGRHGASVAGPWYHGRPVIVRRSDPASGLANGDIGVALGSGNALRVWFEGASRTDAGVHGLRAFAPQSLPEVADAWAITVHRSQGSEYEHVAVVLPPDPVHPLLTRELLYTAVSRARRSVALWATPATVAAAIARRVERHGGLRDRLRTGHG